MAYTDEEYFLTKIKQSEIDNLIRDDAGEAQEANLTSAIASADDKINTYLRSVLKTVPVPDAKVTETIRQCSYDIAMYSLHDRIQYTDVPDRIVRKYDDAIAWLKDVARGVVDLGFTEEEENSGVTYFTSGAIFTRNSF